MDANESTRQPANGAAVAPVDTARMSPALASPIRDSPFPLVVVAQHGKCFT